MSIDNREKYDIYRKTYPEFIYRGYSYHFSEDGLEIAYEFQIPGLIKFHPRWVISTAYVKNRAALEMDEKLDELVFSLGMVELISYWKATCSPKVKICSRRLCSAQTEWWKKLYYNGLGEFFYTNGIVPGNDFMDIECEPDAPASIRFQPASSFPESILPRVLVPVGGGKDSAVTLELLRGKADRVCYVINPRKATIDTEAAADTENIGIAAKRYIDRDLILLNTKGFLNGHTPFSAIVAFSSVITAYISGIEYIALSNESSANESTVPGSYVNHQYSKSYEFENDFREYEREYIKSGVEYFSFLRPLTELQIAWLFSRYKKPHSVFRSCNVGSKKDIWCGECSKCLFVYLILSPFLSDSELGEIFGRNLLEDESLLGTFDKLTGILPEKPFECVGSRDEVCAAIDAITDNMKNTGRELPALLEHYSKVVKNRSSQEKLSDYAAKFDSTNSLNAYFEKIIRDAVNSMKKEVETNA